MTEDQTAVSSASRDVIENFHTVDCWAVTYPVYHSVVFHWTVKNFLQTSNKGMSLVRSPNLEEKSYLDSIPREREWQLRLVPHAGMINYIAIHLCLMKARAEFLTVKEDTTNPFKVVPKLQNDRTVRADFQVSIVDHHGNVLMQVGGQKPDPCIFRLRSCWGYDYFLKTDRVAEDFLTPSGDLMLKCQIWVYGESELHTYRQGYGGVWHKARAIEETPQKNRLGNDLWEMFQKGVLADVQIQVESSDTNYLTHKMVLAGRSPVFAAMFDANHQTQECQKSTVKIKDFDAPVVYAMLEYLYSNKVCMNFVQERCVDLFRIADKYSLPELRVICQEVIADNLTVENCMYVLAVADMHQCGWLKDKCLKYIQKFQKTVMKDESFLNNLKAYPSICSDLYMYSQ